MMRRNMVGKLPPRVVNPSGKFSTNDSCPL
jgi:hypothetical protein